MAIMETNTCDICGASVEKRKAGPHKSVHVRQAKAKYIYKDGDRKHPYHWDECKECGKRALMKVRGAGFCSLSCSQMGSRNSMVNRDPDGYAANHRKVSEALGKASGRRCMCGERAAHWANLTGNYVDTYDYTAMCARCHNRYDRARRSMEEG